MPLSSKPHRESVPDQPNRLGMDGIEFIEYATTRPQAFGDVLERMGFQPVARHRSREVTLFRQGGINLIVNANPDDARVSALADGQPVLSAVAFRVQDAQKAQARCVELGAWSVPSHAQAMELHIPAVRGPAGSNFYFVDRWKEFSIYDIDFKPIVGAQAQPAAIGDMELFGVVQYVGQGGTAAWAAYYQEMFDFTPVPDEERFGILPKGKVMRSPCQRFWWQLIEPRDAQDAQEPERLQRLALGTPDVPATVQALKHRGVEFVDSAALQPGEQGALTRNLLGDCAFELVLHAGVRGAV